MFELQAHTIVLDFFKKKKNIGSRDSDSGLQAFKVRTSFPTEPSPMTEVS